MGGGAWWAAVHGVAKSRTRLSDFTFTFHFRALEKEMETHSSVLSWRNPGTGGPGELPSMGSHRVWTRLKQLSSSSVYLLITKSEFIKIWNASQICMSSLLRGHANLLCTVPILVYVLPKWALCFSGSGFLAWCVYWFYCLSKSIISALIFYWFLAPVFPGCISLFFLCSRS